MATVCHPTQHLHNTHKCPDPLRFIDRTHRTFTAQFTGQLTGQLTDRGSGAARTRCETDRVSDEPNTRGINDPDVIRRLMTTPGRWAVVGLSANRSRVAYDIAAFLQRLGNPIVPVHPKAEDVHGATGYPTLADVPGPIDVVDIFVRSELAGDIVDQAIAVGAKAVWLQLGVIDQDAAQRALAAGLDVVMDTCPKIEAPRVGVNVR